MRLGVIDFSEKHANIGTIVWATVTAHVNKEGAYTCSVIYNGSKTCPNVCMSFTKVDNSYLYLTWVLTMSVWNKAPALGSSWVQESKDLGKIQQCGSHIKMTCHWDTYLTLHLTITI